MSLPPESQGPRSIQETIEYYISMYEYLIPTAAEARAMLNYLEQSELPFYRRMLGEIQFSRSMAMDWIYKNAQILA
jgi:hypothetical protein